MKTSLYNQHCALGAKIVSFAGWEMPIHYQGILHEHAVVREKVGVFDVSHMGRITIEGKDALSLLNYLSTNQIDGKKDGTATYTVWCDEKGMCIDDLIIYQESPHQFFIVVNAGNRDKDLAHLKKYAQDKDVIITEHYDDEGMLAVQGPNALALLSLIFPNLGNIKKMHFIKTHFHQQPLIISCTGYTGEEGVEIYASKNIIDVLWKIFLEQGQIFGVEPIGLGARDTLRLEMGYALYGHELSEAIAASESVSAWAVKLTKMDFLGKKALEQLEFSSHKKHAYGVCLLDKGIAREGYLVFKEGKQIGKVTSGTFSPTLNQAIAIILVEASLKIGEEVSIQIRQNFCQSKVVALPFKS